MGWRRGWAGALLVNVSATANIPVPLVRSLCVELDGKREWLLTANDGGELVGCARVLRMSDEIEALGGVFVREDWRGRGAGRMLVRWAERLARGDGAKALSALVTHDLVAWYAALGWEPRGRDGGAQTDGVERVIMMKRL